MAKSVRQLSYAVLFALLFVARPLYAELPSGPPEKILNKARFLGLTSAGQGYDISKERTLTGVIEEIGTVSGKADVPSYMVEITIRGKSQKTCRVELAPYWYLQSRHLALPKGSKIKVRGFLRPDGENYHMLATAVISDKGILPLRNKVGIPVWQIKPKIEVGVKARAALSRRKVVTVTGDISPEVSSQRPLDYGPPQWEQAQMPPWLAWMGETLDRLLNLVGGPQWALLILLGILLIVMIRSLNSRRRSWRAIKAKHAKNIKGGKADAQCFQQ